MVYLSSVVSISETIEVNKESNYVFDLAQDYKLRLDWDPFLKDIKFLEKNTVLERGLKVWVKAYNGMEMTVEYLNYSPPHHVSMQMIDGPRIFADFSGLWKFKPVENNKTLVFFKYHFKPSWWAYLGVWFIKRKLSNDMEERLTALKKASESGNYDELVLQKN